MKASLVTMDKKLLEKELTKQLLAWQTKSSEDLQKWADFDTLEKSARGHTGQMFVIFVLSQGTTFSPPSHLNLAWLVHFPSYTH